IKCAADPITELGRRRVAAGRLKVSRRLDDDLADHVWMDRTEILELARHIECVREFVVGVEGLRFELQILFRHDMREVVAIDPGDGRAGATVSVSGAKVKLPMTTVALASCALATASSAWAGLRTSP